MIFEWDNYKNDLISIFEINRRGLAIYGGVLGGVAVALIYYKVKRISFWSLADTLMPSLVLGQAIGRWGILSIKRHTETKLQILRSAFFLTAFT